MSAGVELIEVAAEHQFVLENLLQLYVYEFSELIPLDVGKDGRFSYMDLRLYWSDAARFPFLAWVDGKLAGFALFRRLSEPSGDGEAYDMAEFFVLRRYRHRGIGRELAEKVWLRFPGRWQVRVMANNVGAFKFWASAIAKFTRRAADFSSSEIGGTKWHVFSFDTRRQALDDGPGLTH